ncbi:hypothetical protein QBC44DRAFT_377111 [Cladorrhinum sp. PSN332]|nr:hypothetical protein QBC44DRAFT_377111 [Cladorrhinum sp. PSN332]
MASIMALVLFTLAILFNAVSGAGALQSPRRVGMQAFHIRNILWIDGGHFLNQDASVAYEVESSLLSYNMSLSFQVPDGPIKTPHRRSPDAPLVHHGFMFSNLIDRAWLFGGHPVGRNESQIPNNIWRFEPFNAKTWQKLPPQRNGTSDRPYRGAGCNVPKLQKGYYLGGVGGNSEGPEYLHWLHEFDMETETIQSFPVPDYVPVVNQSLVFLDTGSRKGALVALGGSVEKNGLLATAPLTSVFIFDIESREWIQQPVTGLDGGLNQDWTVSVGPPDGGIPRSRVSACAVVGSAQDKTSHNIFLMGGTNETQAITSVWVLSLPSAIWIKAPLRDPFSTPKTENSCLLTIDRFVMMFGGCFLNGDTNAPCMGYGYNPLSYDISKMAIEHYSWWQVGYLVNENISNIIGGDVKGNAIQRAPMFTNFSHPVLDHLFIPPHSAPLNSTAHYRQTLTYGITFPVLPFGLIALYSLTRCAFKYRNSKATSKGSNLWRPSVFSPTYLVFLNLLTLCLIILVAVLAYWSQVPDTNSEHWYGGPDPDVIWTGRRWNSTFTVDPTLPIPPQGLVEIYKDKEPEGEWSERNSTYKRIKVWDRWAFTYLPMIVAVLYGRLWKALDDEIKRLDVYTRLRHPDGESAKDSLFTNHHSFWVPLSIFSALRRRHWCVAISSFGNVLGSIVAPVVQNYMFEWALFSGGRLAWPDTYGWQVALINPRWAGTLIGVLFCALLCSLVLLIIVPRRETGLLENPQGLASIANMLSQGVDIFPALSNRSKLSELVMEFGEDRYQLRDVPGRVMPILCQLNPSQPPVPNRQTIRTRQRQRSWFAKRSQTMQTVTKRVSTELSTIAAKVSPHNKRFQRYLLDHPASFPLRTEVFIAWTLLLITLICLMGYATHQMIQNEKKQLNNYVVPLTPSIYLIVAMIIQSTSDVITYSILSLFPFYILQSPDPSPASTLFTSYTDPLTPILSTITLSLPDIFRAFKNAHTLPVFTFLSSFAITVTTIFLGTLQLSSSFYGATSLQSDLQAAMAATLLLAFVLGTTVGVYYKMVWTVDWEGKGLVRPVETLGGKLTYLMWSENLREDLKGVEHIEKRRGRLNELRMEGRWYRFGKIELGNGEEVFGVERGG